MKRQPLAKSTMANRLVRVTAVVALTVLVGGLTAAASGAKLSHSARVRRINVHRTHRITAHGQLIRPFKASQSDNWSGYNQGILETDKPFTSITGHWIVPTATQHKKGQAEYSADWIGIGGGCLNPSCTVTDETLIQTGTEQDVSSSGKASYSAWYELIPAPSLTISMAIHPGNKMYASISEAESLPDELWTITLKDLSTGKSYSTTVPYSSTQATAEWIEETPLEIGTNGTGLSALPNLTSPKFSLATTNGANADLSPSQEVQLVNSSGKVIADPSAPNATHNGFNVCAWASACAAP